MNLKNLKIETQLKLGFAILLFLVVALGTVAYIRASQIHQQMVETYEHPLTVRRALSTLGVNILTIQRNIKDMMITTDETEIAADINEIEMMKSNALEQIEILSGHYLGPKSDIDSLKQAVITWHVIYDETFQLLHDGNVQEAVNRTKMSGVGGKRASLVLSWLKRIDNFAIAKTEEFYTMSEELNDSFSRQLLALTTAIIFLSFIIFYFLFRTIRKPLAEMLDVTKRFAAGDMAARSLNTDNNEFRVLSDSFNTLASGIEMKAEMDKKFANLAELMLSEYDVKKFFQATLKALATHTGSQMAAIYLLSNDHKTFDHFESLGVVDNGRQSFAADRLEGEFGAAVASRKVQHIKNIPEDTRFVFYTVSGRFIPHEIITIPILADKKIIAVISLASISRYSNQSIQLVDNIHVTLCARVEGILAYHKIQEFLEKLESQNQELESQTAELASQAAELREQNAELEMQKKQLDEANRLKTNFLSNMSHELRTPLNSVIALSGVLNRRLAKKIPDEEYSYLEVIERNGKNLLEIINDILDISRIEAGREEIEITKFDANALISSLVTMILPQASGKNIALRQKISDSDLFMTSDAGKCSHILQNLISNAVKFTEKGYVEVAGRIVGQNMVITVTDTGIGIAEKHLAHIFDEFRQADGSTSRKFGGTGLGLAIARKYATLLGGTVSVKSTEGRGSEFSLTLPLNYSGEIAITETKPGAGFGHFVKPAGPQTFSGLPGKTILLVDDSEPAIIQMKNILEESGYRLLIARDGGEALGIIAQTIPDAMILDLMMPGMDGFEVLKTLREAEKTAHIPVLILTAKHITKEELLFLKRNNVHELIMKGDINRSELLNAIATMSSSKS
ncbi:MAG: ATP-binding protein [Bacteroidetes bacterium]|nr:ATP-binding protein [Bacteroidota bacterium]